MTRPPTLHATQVTYGQNQRRTPVLTAAPARDESVWHMMPSVRSPLQTAERQQTKYTKLAQRLR